jgi:GTPase
MMQEILSQSLSSGQKGLMRFRFDIPEVVKPGTMMIFREKGVHGMGYVTSVFPDAV